MSLVPASMNKLQLMAPYCMLAYPAIIQLLMSVIAMALWTNGCDDDDEHILHPVNDLTVTELDSAEVAQTCRLSLLKHSCLTSSGTCLGSRNSGLGCPRLEQSWRHRHPRTASAMAGGMLPAAAARRRQLCFLGCAPAATRGASSGRRGTASSRCPPAPCRAPMAPHTMQALVSTSPPLRSMSARAALKGDLSLRCLQRGEA